MIKNNLILLLATIAIVLSFSGTLFAANGRCLPTALMAFTIPTVTQWPPEWEGPEQDILYPQGSTAQGSTDVTMVGGLITLKFDGTYYGDEIIARASPAAQDSKQDGTTCAFPIS